MEDRVAKIFAVGSDTHERGEYLGTVCAKCRDRADDRKASILGIFDKMSGGRITVQVVGDSDDGSAKRAFRAMRVGATVLEFVHEYNPETLIVKRSGR
jgi:hypothetical protein